MPVQQKTGDLCTASQAAALKSLQRNFAVKCLMPRVGSVKVRTHTLLVGPTGVGKTEVIQRFAAEMGLATITIPCNSWIPWGAATNPSSLTSIAAFIGAADSKKKLIFLDEVDKTVPPGAAYGSSWALGVFGEVLALLDGDSRLKGAGWSDEHIVRLADAFIVGAGAFQQLAAQQRDEDAAARRPQVGFAAAEPVKLDTPHYSRRVNGQGLPPEIASRFCSEVVMLAPPTEAEYARGIIQIHSAFKGKGKKIAGAEISTLAKAAVNSNEGLRWFESYCLRLAANAVEKDIPLLKLIKPGPGTCVPTPGAASEPAKPPGKNGEPWVKGGTDQNVTAAAAKAESMKAQLLAAMHNPVADVPVPRMQPATPPKTTAKPVHGEGRNPPARPAGWVPAIVATQSQAMVRRAAMDACRSVRSLLWHAGAKQTILEDGENELYGTQAESAAGGGLITLLRCIAWSCEEYWNPRSSEDDLYGHESNFALIGGLVIRLERELGDCQSEYVDAGLGTPMLDAISGLRDFAVEWALWRPVSWSDGDEGDSW